MFMKYRTYRILHFSIYDNNTNKVAYFVELSDIGTSMFQVCKMDDLAVSWNKTIY